ncbi:HU family DNA-binding protein [soil metagenome]
MKKDEFIRAVADKTNMTLAATEQAFAVFVETLTDTLVQQDTFVIPGFGTIGVKQRAARSGRNPQTGKTIEIAATTVAYLKPSSVLKARLNPNKVTTTKKPTATKKVATV